MILKEKVDNLLSISIRRTENVESLKYVYQELLLLKENFNSPLTVAIVGLIKAGKSTVINALIQEELLVTNHQESTYTLTKFVYSEEPFLKVQFKDNSFIDDDMQALDYWTSRSKIEENPRLNDVEMVIIGYPNEMFKKIEIVDTPGLGSVYGVDSENTKSLIGAVSQEDKEKSTKLTKLAMTKADAIICAFRGNLRKNNLDILKSFLQHFNENGNPSNSIGIFTRCDDAFWQDKDDDPCIIARGICENNYMKRREIRKSFYTILPITALPAQGVASLDNAIYSLFKKLSILDDEDLFQVCSNAEIFCEMDIGEFVINQEERRKLFDIYGRYGIYYITNLVRKGFDVEHIKKSVFFKMGLEDLLNIVINHFGNRADIIKAKIILNRLMVISQEINVNKKNADETENEISKYIENSTDEILSQEHCFKELNMVKLYYNHNISLSEDDEEELLCITGEYGYNCEARLGVEEGTKSIKELKEIAYKKMKKWSKRSNAPLVKRNEKKLAAVLKRSCEIIYYHLEKLSEY